MASYRPQCILCSQNTATGGEMWVEVWHEVRDAVCDGIWRGENEAFLVSFAFNVPGLSNWDTDGGEDRVWQQVRLDVKQIILQASKMRQLEANLFIHRIAKEDRKLERPFDHQKIDQCAQCNCTGVRQSTRTNARSSTRRSMTKSAKAHNHKAW